MNDFVSNNIITILVVAFVFEILMGMLAQSLAERKGQPKSWFWAGFLLSLPGAVWVAGLPDNTIREQMRHLDEMRETVRTVFADQTISTGVGAHDDGGDDELAAVLSAAVAAMGEEECKRFILRSFRPVGESATAWARAGRQRSANTH